MIVVPKATGQNVAEISPNIDNVPELMDSPAAAEAEVDDVTWAQRPKRQFLAGLALGSLIAHRRPYYGHGYRYPYYGGYHQGYYPYHGYGG